MSDELAFLRAAQAQPDDDTLRLVYADWLEEQGGESQARFVRLQVKRSRLDAFDPDRAGLLQEEAKLIQKHKRYWNGRVHRDLHRRGLLGLIDSRRGLIRKWDYHRGMIARASIVVEGIAEHAGVVPALGPIQGIELRDWRTRTFDEERALEPLIANVKTVALRESGVVRYSRLEFAALRRVQLLDLRSVAYTADPLADLRAGAARGDLPSVVLFRRTVMIPQPARQGYVQQDAHQMVHVIDPHGKWDALRLWFADFTGELLDPVRV